MRQGPPVFRRDAEALRRRKPWFSGEKRGFPVMGYEGRETNSGYMRERERERERGLENRKSVKRGKLVVLYSKNVNALVVKTNIQLKFLFFYFIKEN
jgi:hypothetical protein